MATTALAVNRTSSVISSTPTPASNAINISINDSIINNSVNNSVNSSVNNLMTTSKGAPLGEWLVNKDLSGSEAQEHVGRGPSFLRQGSEDERVQYSTVQYSTVLWTREIKIERGRRPMSAV